MRRSLEHAQIEIVCSNAHEPHQMNEAGFYALKEAGAKRTIIAFKCPQCRRTLFITEESPYAPDLEAIDSTP